MRNSRKVDVLSIILIAGALIGIGLSQFRLPPDIDRKLNIEVGRNLAQQAARLGLAGKEVTLIVRDTEAFAQPAMDIAAEAFKDEISRAGVKSVSTHKVRLDPLKLSEVPSGDFFEILRRASDQDVVVSLLGPPLLNEEQRKKLGKVKAKVVAFCPGRSSATLDLNALFSAGLIHCAIVERLEAKAARGAEGVNFSQLYTVLDLGNTASLAAQR